MRRIFRRAITPVDTTPPSVPTGATVADATTTTLYLTWNPSSDNYNVIGYRLEKDGVEVPGLIGVTNTLVTGLTPSTSYNFRVKAEDNSGNQSSWSGNFGSATASDVFEGGPSLSLGSPTTSSMGMTVVATPRTGRSIVGWEIQRLIGGTWTTVTAPRLLTASELPAPSTATPTKYIHPSGTLGGNAAYTTFAAAMAAAVPGDEIAVGGTFTSRILWTVSGTALNPIRIRAYDPVNPPIIDGQGTQPEGWSESGFATGSTHLVALQAEHVILDGFTIKRSRQHGIGIGACNNNGSFFNAADPWRVGVKVYRCTIDDIPGTGITTWKAEDYVVGLTDLKGCQKGAYWETTAGNPVGWGSAVNMCGRNGQFIECTIRQTMGEGIHIGAHIAVVNDGGTDKGAGCDGFVIRGCKFYDTWSGPLYITLGGNGVVENNQLFMSNDTRFWYSRNSSTGYPQYALSIGCELGYSYGGETPPTLVYDGLYQGVQGVVIRNNIISGANRNFMIVRYTDTGNYKDLDIDHNTIFCNRGAYPSIYENLYNSATAAGNEMTGVRFRNNAVVATDAGYLSDTWNARGSGAVTQGNLFSHTPPSDLSSGTNIINSSSTVLTDRNYSATSSGYPNEVVFDLTKAAPYRSGSVVSPLCNAVASIGTPTDFYGHTRPTSTGLVDIGAISLSMEGTAYYEEEGLAAGTLYSYRARFQEDDGSFSAYSNIDTEATL